MSNKRIKTFTLGTLLMSLTKADKSVSMIIKFKPILMYISNNTRYMEIRGSVNTVLSNEFLEETIAELNKSFEGIVSFDRATIAAPGWTKTGRYEITYRGIIPKDVNPKDVVSQLKEKFSFPIRFE